MEWNKAKLDKPQCTHVELAWQQWLIKCYFCSVFCCCCCGARLFLETTENTDRKMVKQTNRIIYNKDVEFFLCTSLLVYIDCDCVRLISGAAVSDISTRLIWFERVSRRYAQHNAQLNTPHWCMCRLHRPHTHTHTHATTAANQFICRVRRFVSEYIVRSHGSGHERRTRKRTNSEQRRWQWHRKNFEIW